MNLHFYLDFMFNDDHQKRLFIGGTVYLWECQHMKRADEKKYLKKENAKSKLYTRQITPN